MKTLFYDRTSYKLSSEPVPNCFIKLDEHFDVKLADHPGLSTHRNVLLAESMCGRMADVEMYAFLLEDVRKRNSLDRAEDLKAAILTRSFVLGYLATCKALLDSCAVTLALLYDLPLSRSERHFGNGDFWHQLVMIAPAVHRRYHPLRLFFNEIFRWHAESVYRIPPIMVLHGHYGHLPGREAQLKVVDESNVELDQMANEPYRVNWVDPIDLFNRWKPRLLSLCEKVCIDIENCT